MWLATTGDDVSADGEVRDAAWGANGSRRPDCIRGPHEVNSPVVKDAMTWSGRSGAGIAIVGPRPVPYHSRPGVLEDRSMARMIGKCLGGAVLLGPLAAMLAMIEYGVPQLAPSVVLPGWSDSDDVDTSNDRKDVSVGGVEKSEMAASSRPERLARPLPATSRRARDGQLMAATQLTWSNVRAGLAAHGIKRFKIQPGSRAGEVHFSCVQPVPGLLRVVRRYEAEAVDPVRAARDVLLQIEQADRANRHVVRAR